MNRGIAIGIVRGNPRKYTAGIAPPSGTGKIYSLDIDESSQRGCRTND